MEPVLDYLLDHNISPQWRGLLMALAAEFEAQIGVDELRQLMNRIGSRFAAASPLGACETTVDLSDALNERWCDAQWGFVSLADEPRQLRIVHHCAPLKAFGAHALAWTPAFLEGAYQTWLAALGGEGLSVTQASDVDEHGTIEFRLSRRRHDG
jgi:hypothetical protein